MKRIIILLLTLFLFIPRVLAAEDLTPNSKSGILIDATSGEILFQKNVHEKLAPASMTKTMTMLLVMEAIEAGKIDYNDMIVVSENASSMGGSQIFLETNSKIRLSELLKGVAIASANDAAVALAEAVGGTTANFVEIMNNRARELGATNTNFKNPHGLDDADHYSTAYDMSLMARELVKHEKILDYTRIYEDYLKKPDGTSTWLVNTNKLVRFYEGVDGLKTGFTDTAGYCLTATAKKNDLRLITVVMGVETSEKRSADTTKLLNYGFNSYKSHVVLELDAEIGEVRVEYGKKESVDLKLIKPVVDLQKVDEEKKIYTFSIKVKTITAPVNTGDEIGTLEIMADGKKIQEVPLTVKENVEKAHFGTMLLRNIKNIFAGKKLF